MIRSFGSVQGLKNQPQGLLLGLGTGGDAQPGDVISGKKFTNDLGEQTGNGSNAKRWASGTVTSSSGTSGFNDSSNGSSNNYTVNVTGLNFTPSVILLHSVDKVSPSISTFDINNNYYAAGTYITNISCNNDTFWRVLRANVGASIITNGSFTMPVLNASTSYRWIAYE